MRSNRGLVLSAYALGLFCMVPLLETVISVAPLSPSVMDWRFGAVGRLSQNSITPLLGLGVLIAAAQWQGHRRVTMALSAFSLLVALGALVLGTLFASDMMAVRTRVAEDLIANFDITSRSALIRLTLTTIVAGLMTWGTWTSRGKVGPRHAAPEPGVVASSRRASAE